MLRKLKNWILKDEIARLDMQTKMADIRYKEYTDRLSKNKLESLLRIQLKGFDLKLLDTDLDVEDWYTEIDSRRTFLEQCHELWKSKAFEEIGKFLIRNQMQYTTVEAESLDDWNFGRATINGIRLIKDEVDRLNTIYQKEVAPPEKFDEHEIT